MNHRNLHCVRYAITHIRFEQSQAVQKNLLDASVDAHKEPIGRAVVGTWTGDVELARTRARARSRHQHVLVHTRHQVVQQFAVDDLCAAENRVETSRRTRCQCIGRR